MTAFISWYILITLLGWITFPLAYRLFPALADRGYTLSRAFGLMLWGFIFWLSANFGIAQNDLGGLLLGLVVLAGLSVWSLVNHQSEIVNRKSEITGWLKENIRLILTTELLFLLAFGFLAFFRSANPEILGTEKPMELMFINGIMNSPDFPAARPVAFGIRHLLLLLWLRDDRHAGDLYRRPCHDGIQPHAGAGLRSRRPRRVWGFV